MSAPLSALRALPVLWRLKDWRRLPKDARYLAVGAACALIYNILLISVVSAGLAYFPATLLVMVAMFFIGYGLHVVVTFDVAPSMRTFLRYCLTIIASYPAFIFVLFVLSDGIGAPIWLASPLTTIFMFVWNYFWTHWAILRGARKADL